MKRDGFSNSAQADAYITALIQRAQQSHRGRKEEPEVRMADDVRRAFQAEGDADARSLERVLSRLVNDEAQEKQKVIFLPQLHLEHERTPHMKNTVDPFSSAPQKKVFWGRRPGLLVAVLCLLALVGSFLTVLNSARSGTKPAPATGSQQTTPATPTPTVKTRPVGTIVFQKVVHNDPAAWSPQGNRLAGSASDGVTPETWDGLTGANITTYQLPNSEAGLFMMDAAWSADGHDVVFAYSNEIIVFDARSGAILRTLTPKKNYVYQGLALSPDGKYLATVSCYFNPGKAQVIDNRLIIYSLTSGQTVASIPSSPYNLLSWSPDGKYLAAGGASEQMGKGVVWDLWNPVKWKIVHSYTATDFSWSPDGSQIALVRNGKVDIVTSAQDAVVRSFAGSSNNSYIAAISWQPHGTRLLVETLGKNAQSSYLSLWDTDTGAHIYTFKKQCLMHNDHPWSSDGKYVLSLEFRPYISSSSATPDMTSVTPPVGILSLSEIIWLAA